MAKHIPDNQNTPVKRFVNLNCFTSLFNPFGKVNCPFQFPLILIVYTVRDKLLMDGNKSYNMMENRTGLVRWLHLNSGQTAGVSDTGIVVWVKQLEMFDRKCSQSSLVNILSINVYFNITIVSMFRCPKLLHCCTVAVFQ